MFFEDFQILHADSVQDHKLQWGMTQNKIKHCWLLSLVRISLYAFQTMNIVT